MLVFAETVLRKLVDQQTYGTNTCYLTDFIQISFSAKLLNPDEIRNLYVEKGQSAAQIAAHFGVAKSVILARLRAVGIREGVSSRRNTNPENYRCRVAPFGYSVRNGRLVPNKAELRICRATVDMIKRTGISANAAAKELARRGYKNRAGRVAWDHTIVRSIFKRWKDKL